MKAEIDAIGCLTISAETELEAFALKYWSQCYQDEGVAVPVRKSTLEINCLLKKDTTSPES